MDDIAALVQTDQLPLAVVSLSYLHLYSWRSIPQHCVTAVLPSSPSNKPNNPSKYSIVHRIYYYCGQIITNNPYWLVLECHAYVDPFCMNKRHAAWKRTIYIYIYTHNLNSSNCIWHKNKFACYHLCVRNKSRYELACRWQI
jgi:hypothetical protein